MRSPVVKAFSLGIITGSFLTAAVISFAAPVKADTAVQVYADRYAGAVCNVLDEYPTFDGIIGIGTAIVEDGFTPRQAGQVMGIAVLEVCPRHTGLMNDFVNYYAGAAA